MNNFKTLVDTYKTHRCKFFYGVCRYADKSLCCNCEAEEAQCSSVFIF